MHRIFTTPVVSVYPHYVTKVERKGRTIRPSSGTGYDEPRPRAPATDTTFDEFFAEAQLNPKASSITGVVCGVRVEDIDDPLMQKVHYLDKLVDELAKGKPMEKTCSRLTSAHKSPRVPRTPARWRSLPADRTVGVGVAIPPGWWWRRMQVARLAKETPSLVKMWLTWLATVFSLMTSSCAIPRFVLPRARRRRVSSSRWVSPSGDDVVRGSTSAFRAAAVGLGASGTACGTLDPIGAVLVARALADVGEKETCAGA